MGEAYIMRPGYEFGQREPGKPVGIESAAISR